MLSRRLLWSVAARSLAAPHPQLLAPCRVAPCRHAAVNVDAKVAAPKKKIDPKGPLPPPTFKEKMKKEFITILKINLCLLPILIIGGFYMYPPVSAAKEKELLERYRTTAGWKT